MTDDGCEWIDDPLSRRDVPRWTLRRVTSGHTGWVRSVCVDPVTNAWFATGSADQTIKVWDLATGKLKVTLTGHVSAVRAVQVSPRHPLLFSAGEDRMCKSWDLERNAVVRQYHGHLHGIYSLAVHPLVDLLVSGSRDATVKVWDVRTKQCIYTLTGHKDTVNALLANSWLPHLVSGGQDSHIRLWDLRTASTMSVLSHHKKGVRALADFTDEHAMGGGEFAFVAGSADGVRKFAYPKGSFVLNYDQTEDSNSLVDVPCNALAVNADGILAGGYDDGELRLWSWYGGRTLQPPIRSAPQPGSLASENGISALTFDMSGYRLLTAELDKTIKLYAPVDPA
jgi:pleiotropic regulator 1